MQNEIGYPFHPLNDWERKHGLQRSRFLFKDQEEYKAFDRADYKDEVACFFDLFNHGGKLEYHGFRLKQEVREQAGGFILQEMMQDMRPSSETKTATIALLLRHWCVRCEPEPRPEAFEKVVIEAVTLNDMIGNLPREKERKRKKPKKSYRIRKMENV